MELISKVSKGSKMDQIYIPKKRCGLAIGDYVVIKPLETKKTIVKPYFFNINSIEPIKLEIIKKIIEVIDKTTKDHENIIITGSFLDKGFNFNDIDIILISNHKLDTDYIKNHLEETIEIKIHILLLNNKTLIKGLSTDPLYQMMLSKYVSKKRFVYNPKQEINYKLLDLHLLKSKILIDNFDILNGNEKYNLIRNLVSISLFLENKKVDKEKVDKEIKRLFNIQNIKEIKQNLLKKKIFLKKYKTTYNQIFNKIMKGIQHATK